MYELKCYIVNTYIFLTKKQNLMSKKTSYLLGIVLTIILGTILYYFLCCSVCCNAEKGANNQDDTKSVVSPTIKEITKNAFVINDASGDFNLKLNDNFNFKTSNFSIEEPVSKDIENGVLKLKDYLIENPLKNINITGFTEVMKLIILHIQTLDWQGQTPLKTTSYCMESLQNKLIPTEN